MNRYEHLNLPKYRGNIQKKPGGHPRTTPVMGRRKGNYAQKNIERLTIISNDLEKIKASFGDKIDPKLIFRFKINQETLSDIDIENKFGVTIISVGKKGEYWIAFSDEGELERLKERLRKYGEEIQVLMNSKQLIILKIYHQKTKLVPNSKKSLCPKMNPNI